MVRLRFVLVVASAAVPIWAKAAPTYRTVQSIPIAGGLLQIREDDRLTPALARKMWRTSADPAFVLGADDPAALAFKAAPALPATVRQVDRAGRTVQDLTPDPSAALARVETQTLGRPSHPVYLVTTDNSAGFGSYSGLVTTLYEVTAGRLQPVQAQTLDGKPKSVSLISTLKSGWKIIDRRPGHTVIEQLLCRPDGAHDKPGGEAPFLLSYITYQSDGQGWRVAQRDESGFWEDDDDWPSPRKFPKPSPH